VEVLCGGEVDVPARFMAPTVVRAPVDAKVMADEIFGPILPIVEFASVDAIVAHVNAHDKPLALYVFSGDAAEQRRVLEATSSGGACVNDVVMHVGNPHLPFGGVGASGMGAYHGKTGFLTFSHRRAVYKKVNEVYLGCARVSHHRGCRSAPTRACASRRTRRARWRCCRAFARSRCVASRPSSALRCCCPSRLPISASYDAKVG
jgi:delta 1-pyrroline-5-carboxylate dehydrogenase